MSSPVTRITEVPHQGGGPVDMRDITSVRKDLEVVRLNTEQIKEDLVRNEKLAAEFRTEVKQALGRQWQILNQFCFSPPKGKRGFVKQVLIFALQKLESTI